MPLQKVIRDSEVIDEVVPGGITFYNTQISPVLEN